MKKLFSDLKKEIRGDYGLTKDMKEFIPFEKWRSKLRDYRNNFPEEYEVNLKYLRRKFGFDKLKKIKNRNKRLILFVGIPGAGKTTLGRFIEKSFSKTILLRGHDIVDLLKLYGKDVDKYRGRLKKSGFVYPDPWYISYHYQETLVGELLDLGYNVLFDDHIRTRENRLGYFRLAKRCGAKVIFVQINAPFETYMKREEGRVDDKKRKFVARFILQSDDFSEDEKKKYDKIIEVDGTKPLRDVKKELLKKL